MNLERLIRQLGAIFTIFLGLLSNPTVANHPNIKQDTITLINEYLHNVEVARKNRSNKDSIVYFLNAALDLSNKINYEFGIIEASKLLSFRAMGDGDFISALDYLLTLRPIIEKIEDTKERITLLNNIAHVYANLDLPKEALMVLEEGFSLTLRSENTSALVINLINQAEAHLMLESSENAYKILKEANKYLKIIKELIKRFKILQKWIL